MNLNEIWRRIAPGFDPYPALIFAGTHLTKPFKPGSVRLPLEGIEVAVVDEKGNRLPANEAGELIVSGPNVTGGYLDRPDETAKI